MRKIKTNAGVLQRDDRVSLVHKDPLDLNVKRVSHGVVDGIWNDLSGIDLLLDNGDGISLDVDLIIDKQK